MQHDRDVMEDKMAIYDVGVLYATALDSRNFELLLTCFSDSATAQYEGIGFIENPGDLQKVCSNALSPLDASQHFLGNFSCTTDADTATAQWYFHAQHVKAGTEGGEHFVVAGTYRDRLVRTEGQWKIQHRDLSVTWVTGNPLVLNHS